MLYIGAILSLLWCGKQKDRPYVILAMPFNLILSNRHLYYRNTQCFCMAMPVNMILVMYVILCRLSYDFNKLTILFIHVHISRFISMTNKSELIFFCH